MTELFSTLVHYMIGFLLFTILATLCMAIICTPIMFITRRVRAANDRCNHRKEGI